MIVSNTTPISNFLHLNRIEILQHLFRQIHIPPLSDRKSKQLFQITANGGNA